MHDVRDSSTSPTNSSPPRVQSPVKSSDSTGDLSESSRTADVLGMLGNRRDDNQIPRRSHAALECWNITENELRKYFHVPLSRVAKELNCSRTSLKKICRKNGIQRWPCRQSKCMNARARAPTNSDESPRDECDDERDEERSKAELLGCSSGVSSGSSGDGRDSQDDSKDSCLSTGSSAHSRAMTTISKKSILNLQLGLLSAAPKQTAPQQSIQQLSPVAPIAQSRVMTHGRNAIHERTHERHWPELSEQADATSLSCVSNHLPNGTASYARLPPIHHTWTQDGFGQTGAANDLLAYQGSSGTRYPSTSFTTPLSNAEMHAMIRMQMDEDAMKKKMTAAMKLGETRTLLRDVAMLVPIDARLIQAMEAVDVLINSMGLRV